jgi:hypothetical protein
VSLKSLVANIALGFPSSNQKVDLCNLLPQCFVVFSVPEFCICKFVPKVFALFDAIAYSHGHR